MVKPDFIYDFREFSAEFLRQENNPDLLVGDGAFQSFFQLGAFMDDSTFHASQTHSGIGVDIVADQIHFHKYQPL